MTTTASQLAVMISAFRTADGRRLPQQTRRRLSWIERDDGMVVDGFDHADAQLIRPRWAGEPFNVHECVQALFTMKITKPDHQNRQAA